ncbi:MAG: polyketide cyclase [Nocardioidaceae bacterium]|nr:polyketide cyclase [Nocardioidaceae bacterium]
MSERQHATRLISSPAAEIFSVLCDPQGHVAIDSSGMLQDASGVPVNAVGDRFVVHMDREALGDFPEMGRYDVTVIITAYDPGRHIAWTIDGAIQPPIGHVFGYQLQESEGGTEVTSYCDWSNAHEKWKRIFPIIDEAALKGTLGILDRTVRRGYPQPN